MVIGRNQNPWREADLKKMAADSIPLFRRFSGGGAVYHDLGNTNFCIMTNRDIFERDKHAYMVVRAMKSLGIEMKVNERHDIIDVNSNKVSGAAFKILRNRAYHHGTMLLESNLVNLKKYLDSPIAHEIKSKGVQSVRSSVANIKVSHDIFCKALSKEFQNMYGESPTLLVTPENYKEVHQTAAQLRVRLVKNTDRHGIGCLVKHQNFTVIQMILI